MANTTYLNQYLTARPDICPTIYGYCLPEVPTQKGYIKIGYTDKKDADKRIREQTHILGVSPQILFDVSAMREDGSFFTDKDVHAVLRKKGFQQLNEGADRNEWFFISQEEALAVIESVRTETEYIVGRTATFSMRKEQREAVDMTADYFTRMIQEDLGRPPKFLWNAKMRFGKTFASYQLAKKMGYTKILVLTFKPAVESAWAEDLKTHVDFEGWQFVSDSEAKAFNQTTFDREFEKCDKNKPIVVFGSFQNLLGKTDSGGIKPKNEFIHTTAWDMIIFDEYHFGAWRENAQKLFEKVDEEAEADFDPEAYQKDEAGNAINETWIDISTRSYLYLSGTPFRALYTGEFLEDQIFNWTYSDEQYMKNNWNGSGENPYEALPRMLMLTYKVPDSITAIAREGEYDEFKLNLFFKAEFSEKDNPESARFENADSVQKWLNLIQGKGNIVEGLKLGNDKPPMPFSDVSLLNSLTHTVWYLPSVASCYAMANLLRSPVNKFFSDYNIITCAGAKAGIGIEALGPVKKAMGDPLSTKTITLSCGKLMTGVTVKPWTGIFMLCDIKSPESYFQAAFRVQSPWTIFDDQGNKQILKPECYIFDFALNRALQQISDYSCRLNTEDSNPEKKVDAFIKFLPVLAFDGASMNVISAQDVLDITYAGTSATLLAKRWQTALLVHVDNDTLTRLQQKPEVLDALMKVEGFRALNQDIQTIINHSKSIKDGGRSNSDDPDKDKKSKKDDQNEKEKEMKSLRKKVQENLLKLAARIPSFMYLTDYREQSLQDVIRKFEPELFKKVTGLSVQVFETLCDIHLFDPEKMNQGIFGFRRYENSSLSYAGIDKHDGENIGGWDTSLQREEYEKLYGLQQGSLTLQSAILSMLPEQYSTQKPILQKPTTTKSMPSPSEPLASKFGIPTPAPSPSFTPNTPIQRPREDLPVPDIHIGDTVTNKKHGQGTITFIDQANERIRIQFAVGEKNFSFPYSFWDGYLSV